VEKCWFDRIGSLIPIRFTLTALGYQAIEWPRSTKCFRTPAHGYSCTATTVTYSPPWSLCPFPAMPSVPMISPRSLARDNRFALFLIFGLRITNEYTVLLVNGSIYAPPRASGLILISACIKDGFVCRRKPQPQTLTASRAAQTATATTTTTSTSHISPQLRKKNVVRKLQPVRARLARRQRHLLKHWRRRAALDIRGPSCCQWIWKWCSRWWRQRSQRWRCRRPQRDHLSYHGLPPERAERVGRRRAGPPVLQDRHGRAAAAPAHGVLRLAPTHRRAHRLGRRRAAHRGNALSIAAAGAAKLASHWTRPRVRRPSNC